jgi:hypothetical protein
MRPFLQRLKSRKLLMALATVLLIVCNEQMSLGIPEDAYWAIITPVVAFIVGESYIDGKATGK